MDLGYDWDQIAAMKESGASCDDRAREVGARTDPCTGSGESALIAERADRRTSVASVSSPPTLTVAASTWTSDRTRVDLDREHGSSRVVAVIRSGSIARDDRQRARMPGRTVRPARQRQRHAEILRTLGREARTAASSRSGSPSTS